MSNIKPNELFSVFISVPAILAWLAYGLAVVLAPHLANDPSPLMWSAYAAGGWYALMFVCFFGWIAVFLLASIG